MSGANGKTADRPGQRLERALESLQREERVGLMTHMVLGYPELAESYRIVERLARGGSDIIEVQIPFSDPTADGPVITAACQEALDGGIRVADAFRFLEEVGSSYDIPFLVMSYFNIVFAYRDRDRSDGEGGVRGFARRAAAAGASGLIVPDIPPEQKQEGYPEACRDAGIHPVYVVSPNIPESRLRTVAEAASGLIYATSRTGTTGREMELELERVNRFLAMARRVSGLPLALGFSISRREQVEALRGHAEVAVVGTHLIRVYQRDGLDGLEREVRALSGA
jgi:tryptophan synthase alpha chain